MSIWVSYVVAEFINNIVTSSLVLMSNCYGNKKKYMLKNIIELLILTIIMNIVVYNVPKTIATVTKILVLSSFFAVKFKSKFSNIIMKIFIVCVVFAIYDSIFGIVYMKILNLPLKLFNTNPFSILLVNILFAILTLITINNKKIRTIINNISAWYDKKNILNVIINIILCVSSLWFFIRKTASGDNLLYENIIYYVTIFTIIGFVIGFFKENSDKNYIKKEYDHLFDYAKTYEQEVVEKSKWQHEYENQLVIIKDKIDPENKKAIAYIDKLLKNKPSGDNSQWLIKLSKFPDIGIKGLLHYKICQMIQNNIHVYVDVIDEDLIPAKVPEKLLEENLQDISMALGVYLDNAMQAANESDNKYLIVEFKCTDKKIEFQISNTYKGNISLDQIGQERFSTKGKNHGYGLSIVRDILARNKYLKQEKELNGMYYVQKLIFNFK